MQIKKYKTINLRNHFDSNGLFRFTLDIPFPVDEIAIKYIAWIDNNWSVVGRDPILYQLSCDLFPGEPFFSISSADTNTPLDIRYQTTDKWFRSTYAMQILNFDKSIIDQFDNDTKSDIQMSITLEFRSYTDN